jgi:hypothetical protein
VRVVRFFSLTDMKEQLLVDLRPSGRVSTHQEGTRSSLQWRVAQRRFAFYIFEVIHLFETVVISQALNDLRPNTAC